MPQEVLSRVVSTAKTEVENLASCDKIAGVARLDGSHGLCAWVRDTKAWERFEEPERRRRGHRHEHAAARASVS